MIGKTISHYHILEQLGEGGMGVVYKAEDTKLKRAVALKFLPHELTSDPEAKERFIREAQAAAALSHPNIVTIYEIGESDTADTKINQIFIVMEYVDGISLRKKMTQGPLQEDEVISIASQICSGLSEAHRIGVVHRDIKPENILIDKKDLVKVMDFGLAKLKGVSKLTREASLLGTISYMSPEQIDGGDVDQHTDIWSLGVVMYEMLCGKLPFLGDYDMAVLYTILNCDPKPLIEYRSDLSDSMCRVIEKSLVKSVSGRYHSMEELLSDLRSCEYPGKAQLSAQPKPSVEKRRTIKSLAVLPLKNLSRDPDQEYFADGMTDALITELAKLGSLKIISRTSVMRYKDSDLLLPQIAKELGVDAVVEGSVIRADQRVRITGQLIHAVSDTHLWAESYDGDLKDILFLQRDIARAIAREIQIKLTPQQEQKLSAARPVNPESYEAYLKGRFHWYKLTAVHFDTALKYFQISLEKDPGYALPYVGIAFTWFARSYWGMGPANQYVPLAKSHILKAIELDSSLEVAHMNLACIKFFYEWDWSGAERTFLHAIDLNPNYADTHLFYSSYLRSMGRAEEAFREVKRGLELDPHNFFSQGYYVGHLLLLRQYDKAIQQLTKTLQEEPDFTLAHRYLWVAYQQNKMYDQALQEALKYFTALNKPDIVKALASGFEESGYTGAMNRAAQVLIDKGKNEYVQPLYIARFFAYAGNNEKALEWLEKGYQSRDLLMVNLNGSCDWDNLRDNPDFQNLLRRMNFPA
jgi:serine/threonine protein kinase